LGKSSWQNAGVSLDSIGILLDKGQLTLP